MLATCAKSVAARKTQLDKKEKRRALLANAAFSWGAKCLFPEQLQSGFQGRLMIPTTDSFGPVAGATKTLKPLDLLKTCFTFIFDENKKKEISAHRQ